MEVVVKYLRPDEKTGVLRYRRVFPAPLRRFIAAANGKSLTELKVSLRARAITDPGAMQRYNEAHAQYERVVVRAKKLAEGAYDQLDGPKIAYLAAIVRSDGMAIDDEVRWTHEPGDRKRTRARATADIARQDLAECKEFRALGDVEGMIAIWGDEAASLAEYEGMVVDRLSPSFALLCRAINDAQIDIWEAILARLQGDVVETPPIPEAPKAPKTNAGGQGRTFQAIILELIDKPHSGYSETTKERVRGGLRFLVEAVGDLRTEELTRAKVTGFLDLLAQRPSKLPKEDFWLKLPQLASRYANRPQVPRLTQKTREAYIIALNARWNEARQDGSIPLTMPSPFSDRKFRREARRPKTATGFSPEELTAYFSLPAFTKGDRPMRGKGEAIYWIPLLLAFTGARPEEVAQLLVTDIFQRERDGRWVIRFTDEGAHPVKGRQSLKTEGQESGRRTFPVPKPLLDLGLLKYREFLQSQGEMALFPLLRRKGKRPGIFASFGEWMCDYVYNHGVLIRDAGRQPVREFRHTFSTASRASRLPKDAMKYIQGHKDGDDNSSSDDYGELDDLGDRIDEFQFRVDVQALVKPWCPPGAQ